MSTDRPTAKQVATFLLVFGRHPRDRAHRRAAAPRARAGQHGQRPAAGRCRRPGARRRHGPTPGPAARARHDVRAGMEPDRRRARRRRPHPVAGRARPGVLPAHPAAAIAIAFGASVEMCLALLLFAQIGVGAAAFVVIDRRS